MLAEAVAPKASKKVVGIRPGEKLHEEMISFSDSFNTFYDDDYFFILPTKPMWSIEEFQSKLKTKKIEKPFSYSSDSNKDFLNVEQLRDLISSELLNE